CMGDDHGGGTRRAAPDSDLGGRRRGLLAPDGGRRRRYARSAEDAAARGCRPQDQGAPRPHRQQTGDGLLGEFASVVDAVRCAIEVQREMAARNAGVDAERRIDFRIGINLSDIIIDANDIFGDGVNIAARLKGLAEPGGICVSRMVRDQVRDKLAIAFEDMGEQQVKNIARPVRAYRAVLAETAERPSILPDTAAPRPVPERPSIAVLPFNNVSGDPEQDYFVDGITEDIITALSKWRWFLVIARNSTFAYKGKPVDLKEVGHDLGVRYVLEGSMRRAGQQVRISSQL